MDKSKPIVLGADHYGLPLKDTVRDYLQELGRDKDHDQRVQSRIRAEHPAQ